jgi:hypothetical protein
LNTPIPFSLSLEDVCIPQKEDIAAVIKGMVE